MTADEFRALMARDASIRAPSTWTDAPAPTTARSLPSAAMTPYHEAFDPLRRYRPVS
jgi:hypothetical protein